MLDYDNDVRRICFVSEHWFPLVIWRCIGHSDLQNNVERLYRLLPMFTD